MVFLSLLTWLTFSHAQTGVTLCSHIHLYEGHLTLTANEKVMVCGKSEGPESWHEVPLTQSEYYLKIFLQQEGYLEPRFERKDKELLVWAGSKTFTKTLTVEPELNLHLDPTKKRKVVRAPMTPAKLDEVTQWADTQLRIHGFVCPNINVQAQLWDQSIKVNGSSGEQATIARIENVGLEDLQPEVISRYQAFSVGQVYDVRKIQISAARMLADGFVQSAYYTNRCKEQTVDLQLHGILGPPRLFRFEIGASTEEFPFTNLIFRNTRMDKYASSYTVKLSLSPLNQTLSAQSQLYVLPWTKSEYLGPRIQFSRISEKAYEYFESKLGLDIGKLFDSSDSRWSVRFGPTLNRLETISGFGPDKEYYLSWESNITAMSHNYENSLANQYEGWEARLKILGQMDTLASDVNTSRVDLNLKYLWNVNSYSPPLFVFGIRLDLSAVDADLSSNPNLELPADYRIFYGGSENLRGFSRKSLNNQERGYTTASYLGFELRLIEQLPWRLQPLLLLDFAKLGEKRYQLDSTIYSSSGIGLRWASPFGAIRGSLAKGQIYNKKDNTDYKEEWVFFFSFGQEF